jgi:hypothetical protein
MLVLKEKEEEGLGWVKEYADGRDVEEEVNMVLAEFW